MLRRFIVATAVALALGLHASPAAAQNDSRGEDRGGPGGAKRHHPGDRPRRSVPEFDPAAVGTMAAVLAGGGLLIARRRRR